MKMRVNGTEGIFLGAVSHNNFLLILIATKDGRVVALPYEGAQVLGESHGADWTESPGVGAGYAAGGANLGANGRNGKGNSNRKG